MIFSNKATSIVEAMVAMMIIVFGITGMYKIYTQSTRLADNVQHKIQAIQIAREGIEAVSNIRDTNWLLFSADYKNCWNTFNYDNNCIGNTVNTTDIASGSYIIYNQGNNNRWTLENKTTGVFSDSTYRDIFQVGLDTNGFYTQTGVIDNLKPIYTREIKIDYLSTESLNIISLVQRGDSSGTKANKVELNTVLNNWKK